MQKEHINHTFTCLCINEQFIHFPYIQGRHRVPGTGCFVGGVALCEHNPLLLLENIHGYAQHEKFGVAL